MLGAAAIGGIIGLTLFQSVGDAATLSVVLGIGASLPSEPSAFVRAVGSIISAPFIEAPPPPLPPPPPSPPPPSPLAVTIPLQESARSFFAKRRETEETEEAVAEESLMPDAAAVTTADTVKSPDPQLPSGLAFKAGLAIVVAAAAFGLRGVAVPFVQPCAALVASTLEAAAMTLMYVVLQMVGLLLQLTITAAAAATSFASFASGTLTTATPTLTIAASSVSATFAAGAGAASASFTAAIASIAAAVPVAFQVLQAGSTAAFVALSGALGTSAAWVAAAATVVTAWLKLVVAKLMISGSAALLLVTERASSLILVAKAVACKLAFWGQAMAAKLVGLLPVSVRVKLVAVRI